jgi:hypothetical protein
VVVTPVKTGPLSLRERAGERGSNNGLIISPHPGLLPEGEGTHYLTGYPLSLRERVGERGQNRITA